MSGNVKERLRLKLMQKLHHQRHDQIVQQPEESCQSLDVPSEPVLDSPVVQVQSSRNVHPLKCSIEACDDCFPTMLSLIEHLNTRHDQTLAPTTMSFNTETEFAAWLQKSQRDNICCFLKRTPQVRMFGTVTYYYCSRSRTAKSAETATKTNARKRHLKVQGYTKMNRTCPAHIVKRVTDNGQIHVKYYSTHLCYTDVYDQLGKIRLPTEDRQWVAGKLAMQVPIDVILREVRNNLDGQLQRRHILTKKDICNIERAFHLNRPERQHRDDATSVSALVHKYRSTDNCPVLAYKGQGAEDFGVLPEGLTVSLPAEDFIFVMMDAAQCTLLKTYGNGEMSVVCVDSTHGTNAYDFHLTTVMVLDSNRQGFPVAFLYSNKLTEETFCLFFQVLQSSCGVIHCNSFMSDMAPQFYNAWQSVMGEVPHRLFCAWHVDKSFRENCRRLITNSSEKVVHVYKRLRTIMDEPDITTFETIMPTFVSQLQSDSETAAFGQFFALHYSTCTSSWAYCYRAKCGINTNMHLERMHGIFKHVYQRGKKNKRLDSAIAALINLVYDKQFDRLISICKGKYTKKLSELRKRHSTSEQMQCITAEMIPGKEWGVTSSTNDHEMHTVTFVKDDCTCLLRCYDCSACIHTFSCTCPDNQTFFNMCKHIHRICQVRREYPHVPESAVAVTAASEDSDDETESGVLTIANITDRHVTRETEAAAHISQLSRPTMSMDERKTKLLQLVASVPLLVTSAQTAAELDIIETGVLSMKAQLQASRVHTTSSGLLMTAENRSEPANKNIEQQRRFMSTKRRRLTASRNALAKPSQEERNKIELELLQLDATDSDCVL